MKTSVLKNSSQNIIDTMPFCCKVWDKNGNIIDCNETSVKLYGLKNKEDYIENFFGFLPEHQNAGRRSDEKIRLLVKKAFEEGSCISEWLYRLPDRTPLPSEIILLRIKDGEDDVVIEYTWDLRAHKQMMQESEQKNTLLHTLNNMFAIMLQMDIETFESDMLRAMGFMAEAAKADRVYLWKNYVREDRLYCSQLYEWSEGAESQQNYTLAMETSYSDIVPEWEEQLSQGHCINGIVREMSANEQAALEPQGILSVLAVPVFVKEHFWGFVGFDDCHRERLFSEDEEMILRSASQLITNALIRNEEASKAREAEERTRLMLDAMPLCCLLWDRSFNCIDCNEAALKLFGFKTKQEYIKRFFECFPEYQSDGQRSVEKAYKLINKTFDEGYSFFEWMYRRLDGVQIPAEMTLVRVKYGNDFVVAAYTRDLRNIKLMEKNIRYLKTEVDKIYFDSLTGINNRRFFDEKLQHTFKTLSRSGSTLSLMMIDIDYFKNFNDTYGHIEGDNCLKIIAETLAKSITRATDVVARYGGEEFVVVLPNTEEKGARMIAERMLKNIRQCNIPHKTSTVANCVTVSIGITTGKVMHTDSVDDFIKKADETLYISKQSGRNRYTFEQL